MYFTHPLLQLPTVIYINYAFFVADTGLKARIGEIFLKIAQMQQEIISN